MAKREGFFRRIWNALTQSEPPPPPSSSGPAESYEPPGDDTPVLVPARGDVYDFQVSVHLKWDSPSRVFDFDEIQAESELYEAIARQQTHRKVWAGARGLDPLDPAGAEAQLNEDLATGFCWPRARPDIRCRPTVRVMIDPKLREQKAPLEQQRIEQQVAMQRDEVVRERTEAWLQGFRSLESFSELGRDERQFLLPFAASLVDANLSAVARALANERRTRYDELVGVLAQAIRDHERVGLFEFANAYDKALRTFCRQAGIDLGQWHLADFGEPAEAGTAHPEVAR